MGLQVPADKIEHEQTRIVGAAADARLERARMLWCAGLVSPMKAVCEAVLALLLERLLGAPERHDIVVDLLLGRDLDERHPAVGPIADRLDPHARALLVASLEILVTAEVALPLDQPEPTRTGITEGRDLQVARIGEWAPQMLAAPVANGEPVRVVHGRTIVVDVLAIVEVEEEHARERRKSGLCDVASGIERNLDVEDRRVAGSDGEAVCAGNAR